MLSPASLFSLGQGLVTSLTSKSGTQMPHQLPNPYRNNNAQAAWNLQQQNTNAEADLENQQGQIDLQESNRNAAVAGRDARTELSATANAYNNSGVMLEGSPMIVMERRRQQMQQQIDASTAHSVALAQLATQHAQITRNEGLATLMGQQNANAMAATNFDAQQALARISHLSSVSQSADFIKSLGNLLPGFIPPVKTPGGGGGSGGGGGAGGKGGSPGGDPLDPNNPNYSRKTMPPLAPQIPGLDPNAQAPGIAAPPPHDGMLPQPDGWRTPTIDPAAGDADPFGRTPGPFTQDPNSGYTDDWAGKYKPPGYNQTDPKTAPPAPERQAQGEPSAPISTPGNINWTGVSQLPGAAPDSDNNYGFTGMTSDLSYDPAAAF